MLEKSFELKKEKEGNHFSFRVNGSIWMRPDRKRKKNG